MRNRIINLTVGTYVRAVILAAWMSSLASAQTVSVGERNVADFGMYFDDCPETAPGYSIFESAVAVAPSIQLEVAISSSPDVAQDQTGAYHFVPCSFDDGYLKIRWAAGGNNSSAWRSGFVRPFSTVEGTNQLIDPAVAFNAARSEFTVMAFSGRRVFQSRYAELTPGAGWIFTDCENVYESPSPVLIDKSWIISGSNDELYAAFFEREAPRRLFYGRSIDGGRCWYFDAASGL